ncbi:glycine--tRNA ligase subunit beta, partial [Francisella tularensis subsp. holarctica]|nr:glycine--tRNA ligase subunit beta [Francisella tularensis subsp. holarctica]
LYKEEVFAVDIFESINNTNYDSIKDFAARVEAVNKFYNSDKAQSLIASNKRVANIISKIATDKDYYYNIELAKAAANEYELALA